MPERVITVWPCDHGNVRVEGPDVPLGYSCHTCGATPARYVAVDALLSDEALDAAQDAVAIEHPGTLTDIEHCAQAAIRAALAIASSEERERER